MIAHPLKVRARRAVWFPVSIPLLKFKFGLSWADASRVFHIWVWYGD